MTWILRALLAVLGLGGGFFIGCGNRGGWLGAILTGLIAGLLFSIPMLRDRQFAAAAVIVVCSLLGSIVSSQVSDGNSIKMYLRNQTALTIRVGSYHLGTGDVDNDGHDDRHNDGHDNGN